MSFQKLTPFIILTSLLVFQTACIGKLPSATEVETTDWTTIVASDCKIQNYRTLVEPVLQSRCTSCHVSGGAGAGKYEIVSGTSLSDNELGANYSATLAKLSDDDGGAYDSNPILLYPAGAASHPVVISVSDDDYSSVVEWIMIERDASDACTVTEE